MRTRIQRVAVLALTFAWPSCSLERPLPAASADWSGVPTQTLTLFHPGQSSYEWLLGAEHTRAGERVARGESCESCHAGDEAQLGRELAAGGRLEPAPVTGKPGSLELAVQVAYDAENAHFRFRWRSRKDHPGEAHSFHRYDGRDWRRFGYPKLHALVRAGEQPAIYEDRLSMLIDDGSVPGFGAHGCWVTCHDDMRDMPNEPAREEVEAHPLLGKRGLGRKDVRKYLPATRTQPGWAHTRSVEAIAAIRAGGGFLDLVQWRGHRSDPVGMADDFHVLEYRRMDAGQGPFRSNWDEAARRPRFMYDVERFGSRATRLERIRRAPTALVLERNAAPFDPSWGWGEGDLLPAYVTSRRAASGSAADNRDARGRWEAGNWTLLWTRPLGLSNPDDKALQQGRVYSFGFAVHDDNAGTRDHYVSWPVTVGFGAKAEIQATRLP